MEKVIFLSHVLDVKTPLYGGRKDISFKPFREMRKGDTCNAMHWSLGNHSGTHVDAPRHFLLKGRTVDGFSAAELVFEKVSLVVLEAIKPGQIITPADVGSLARDTELLLIKTGFECARGRAVYWKNGPGFHPELAVWLKTRCPRIRAVGMDMISVTNFQNRELGREAHRAFLGRAILLIEDMKLSGLRKAPSRIVVAPLRVKDADASPCSVFAWS